MHAMYPAWRSATERASPGVLVVLSSVVLLAHATLYGGSTAAILKFGSQPFIGVQAATLFAFGTFAPRLGLALALYAVFMVYALRRLGHRVTPWLIIPGTALLFGLNVALVSGGTRGLWIAIALVIAGIYGQSLFGVPMRDNHRAQIIKDHTTATRSRLRVKSGTPGHSLSEQEIGIIRLVAIGTPERDIAVKLGITERAVLAHLASVYGKLGVETRAGAMTLAVQRGIVPAMPEPQRVTQWH